MSVRIGLGLGAYPFTTADAFWRWIDQCEATAIDSIWLSERLVSRVPNLEPMVALAAIAGRTKRLKFGMNVFIDIRPNHAITAGSLINHVRCLRPDNCVNPPYLITNFPGYFYQKGFTYSDLPVLNFRHAILIVYSNVQL